jgi:hypothetical protein
MFPRIERIMERKVTDGTARNPHYWGADELEILVLFQLCRPSKKLFRSSNPCFDL